ncbi:MAG TPA: 2-hydroxychromene-2-carboxylate isomerase [Kofleriaceae bacterium]
MAVHLYFDFISPYAYLAWTQLRTRDDLEPIPVLFAALLDANGNIGPAEIPAKRSYIIRDIARIAHRFGVPLAAPPSHPFNPLLALRLASLNLPRAQKVGLVDALYREVWAGGRGVTDRDVVAQIAAAHGVDIALADTAKATLRANTDAAIARGIFGVPTVVVDDQMFWGCDGIPHFETYLREGNVVPDALVTAWEALPASSVRKR